MSDVQTAETTKQMVSSQIDYGRESEQLWQSARRTLLEAVPAAQRTAAQQLLDSMHCGGGGLRDWLAAIVYRGASMPTRVPEEVVNVYLHDSDAMPLHDCGDCGFAVPVRPNRLYGMEGEPEHRYFPECPLCGGPTGPYYYWSRSTATSLNMETIRRKRPR